PAAAPLLFPDGVRAEQAKASPYTGSKMFRLPPRQVADLWLTSRELLGQGPPSPEPPRVDLGALLNTLGGYSRELISKEAHLTAAHQQQFQEAWSNEPAGFWTLDPLASQVEPNVGPGVQLAPGSFRKANEMRLRIHLNLAKGWHLKPLSPGDTEAGV